jgi:hypothetical protein
MIQKIESLEDVATFSKELILEGTNFHPDDDFFDYVNILTNESVYSVVESVLRNSLMNQCFEVCEKQNIDVYNFTMEVYLKETGLDKFIPLPSSVE